MTFEGEITVSPDHPSLPGHFPDQPIVPGVVILDLAIALAEREGRPVTAVRSAKFHKALQPGIQCHLVFSATEQEALQVIGTVGGDTVFTAVFESDPRRPDSDGERRQQG